MSAKDCIKAKAKAGKVDKDKTARLVELFEGLESQARGTFGPAGAPDAAAVEAEKALARQTRRRKRTKLKQMRAQAEILARARAHPGKERLAMRSVLTPDYSGTVAGPNVEIQAKVIRGRAAAHMTDFIEKFRSKAAGLTRRKAGQRAIVRELFGESTSDAEAKTLAGGIRQGMEYLRLTFNAAGGDIPKRTDFGLPQRHNRRLVAATAKDEWIAFTFDRLDRAKMIDLDFGRPMGDAKLRRVLGEVYNTIVTDGMIDLKPGGVYRAGIVTRRQEHRFLAFRDADAWFDYFDRFGEGDLFNLVLGHVQVMARDTALIQVMGPNPEATLRFMENVIDKSQAERALAASGAAAARAAGRIGGAKSELRNPFNDLTGASKHATRPLVANILAANRNILTAAMLGGAFFSALTDRTFAGVTARLNGVPASRVLARHLKLFAPGTTADKKLAVRLGFGAQGWADTAIGAQRYVGEVIGPEWSVRTADTVLRLSLLSPWTDAGRWAFSTEMLGFITGQAGKRFSDLPEALRASFRRHGISEPDWDLIRATPLWRDAETGAEFLRPQDMIGALDPAQADTELFRRHFDAANKLQAAVLTETEFAVPSATVSSRSLLLAGTQPGSLMGEVLRNVALFKSFPVSLIQTHLRRAATLQGGANKAKYVAHLVLGTAVLGALGEQLSQISKGRDPLSMDPASKGGAAFWQRALLRGGGLGIFGDFLFSDVNRFGGGIAETILGPVLGTQVPAGARLTIGNVQELIKEGEAKNAGRELVRFTRLMTPGRSLWYAGLAMERLVFDEVQKMIDPNHAEAFRRVERRMKRETGQSFFAPPGRGLPPKRAPRLGAALGK